MYVDRAGDGGVVSNAMLGCLSKYVCISSMCCLFCLCVDC